jgi:two-component system sensor histidine kinase HydH
MIRKRQDGNKVEELSTFIIDEVNRLNKVVNNLLEFARPRPPQLAREDVGEIMDRAIKIIEEKAIESGIEIYKEYSPVPQTFLCDADQMEQAFLNILINAIAGISVGENISGKIFIKIAPQKEVDEPPSIIDYIYVQIKDNGCGIKEEDLPKIFNPFFTTKPDGTGLGLSIVHKIIENHEGEIRVESEIGKGTTVFIKIPIRSV